MKAILLARVSTEEQKEAGNSLPAQIYRLEEYCKRKDFDVIKKFSLDESAYKEKRDEFDKLLEYVQKAAKKEKVSVCFDKVDRLSRSVFDKRVGTLYDMALADKIELHFVSDGQVINNQMSAVEKFQFGMSLGLAKYYSDAISDNVKRALGEMLRQGKWPSKAPLGYLNIGKEKKNKDIIVDESRREYVNKVFDLYIQGRSMLSIKQILEKEGFTTRKNNPVSKSTIEGILKNSFYYGVMVSKGKEYPHIYEPIISRYIFNEAKKVRLAKRRVPSKSISNPFIFKGLIVCEKCGCRISPETKKGKYHYYSCTNFKGICKREYVREEDLLKPIYEVLESLKLTEKQSTKIIEGIKSSHSSKVKYHKQVITTLTSEYTRLQGRSDKLLDVMLDDSITKETYDKKFKEIKEKQNTINIQLEEHTKADEDYGLNVANLLSITQRASEIFKSSDIEEKKQLLGFVFQNFSLGQKKLKFQLRKPFETVLTYAKSPAKLRGSDSNRRPIG